MKMMKRLSVALSVAAFTAVSTSQINAAPVHDAAIAGDAETVFQLIEKDPTMLEIRDEIGASPLYYAASLGHLELARQLVARGAEVTVATTDGLTPLHWAAVRQFYEVSLLMLENGADVNARSTVQANTPLHEVWNNGGSPEIAALLIEWGAETDAVENWYGMTPLHYAAEKGLAELARVLIDHGADLAVTDRWGRTPGQLARDAATRSIFSAHSTD